jgi:hypothetical protein
LARINLIQPLVIATNGHFTHLLDFALCRLVVAHKKRQEEKQDEEDEVIQWCLQHD